MLKKQHLRETMGWMSYHTVLTLLKFVKTNLVRFAAKTSNLQSSILCLCLSSSAIYMHYGCFLTGTKQLHSFPMVFNRELNVETARSNI